MDNSAFHDYKFKIKELHLNDDLYEFHKIKVIGNKVENETFLTSINGDGDYSLYLQNRFFNFTIDNETKIVSAFDADLTFINITFTQIKFTNKSKDAILILDTKDELPSGVGGYIKFDTSKVLYDKDSGLLQLGEYSPSKTMCKFLNNAYAQLSKNNTITCILLTDIDII